MTQVSEIRQIAISIIEEVEEHCDKYFNGFPEPKSPFDEEAWYEIEDKITAMLERTFNIKDTTYEIEE